MARRAATKLKIISLGNLDILESYLKARYFRVKQGEAYSELEEITAGVPRCSVIGSLLYLLYTSDLPTFENKTVAMFADDTSVLAVSNSSEGKEKLLAAATKIEKLTKKMENQNK